ncbi:MAG: DsrE family protein [Lachnospiraceae bacterium]|nr:DsrE family protein [Lachnospiraceae bacterium]
MKAIFHVNDLNKWTTTLNSALNMHKVAKENGVPADIYIVSNGESVLIMKGDPEEMSAEGKDPALAAARLRLQEAFEKKLHVCFCLKAMSLRDLSLPEDLGRAELVASSAFRMAELQEQGYAYIKS